MTVTSTSNRRPHRPDAPSMFRWIAILTLVLVGAAALLPIAPVAADNIAATATVCVPGPDNFCPPTPTPSNSLPLHLYLATIQQSELSLP